VTLLGLDPSRQFLRADLPGQLRRLRRAQARNDEKKSRAAMAPAFFQLSTLNSRLFDRAPEASSRPWQPACW
jgi:hypothetical protein